MSIRDQAKAELERINFGADDSRVMMLILDLFLEQWDSGGAVSVAAPVLMRLINGQPLAPLTGGDDEWHKPIEGDLLQNKRCSTVFKDETDGSTFEMVAGEDVPITFPYDPSTRMPSDPVMEVRIK